MPQSLSLVKVCAECWARPQLLRRELFWRWAFGIPGFALFACAVLKLRAVPALQTVGELSLTDPLATGQHLLILSEALAGPAGRIALWLGPLLAILWAIVSGLGRHAVLLLLDPAMRPARGPLVALQLLRLIALAGVLYGWYRSLGWAAQQTLYQAEPNLAAYGAWAICLSLGLFVVWALVSWVFFMAPLLAMLEGTGIGRSLMRSIRSGPLAARLAEVNLVLGIVRLALIVLAMVFSAIPLPFIADMQGTALYLWWALVTLLYLVANDFFQIVRLAAYVRLWRLHKPAA